MLFCSLCMEEELRISRNVMKAFSASTRTEILRSLEQRQMTASELSRHLGKHVTTIIEHLDLLAESKLVERIERPGHNWVYYKLSSYGKNILHPQPYKIIFVLALSIIALSFGILSLPYQYSSFLTESVNLPTAAPGKSFDSNQQKTIEGRPLSNISIIIIAISCIGIFYSIYKFKRIFRKKL